MGAGKWDATSRTNYTRFANASAGKRAEEIYAERKLNENLDPRGKNRESRDSDHNPNSLPIIVALDVTGSMGIIAETLAKKGLGLVFTALLDEHVVPDPHLMFMGVGDAYYDRAPLQVSQFEADARIIEQLTQIYIEHGGGGNSSESYHMPWYFAAKHTFTDAWEKRQRKGYLFTIGDEETPEPLLSEQIQRFIGDVEQKSYTARELLTMAQERYHVFHIVIEQGSHAKAFPDRVRAAWTALMGQDVIFLPDHTRLAEVIVSVITMNEGKTYKDWTDPTTQRIVAQAISPLMIEGPHA